ncbi:MAG: coenzyme A pyrophosphatase [Odoribacter sp.]|nr:coenzyme A pyrophosphatase [Odoribacter sp.]
MLKGFADKLRTEISKGLPGTEVQWALASSDRMIKGFPKIPREDSAAAAVMILLYPKDDLIYTTFIQRPAYDGVHGGQISFPGGKKEASDTDLIHTAIREVSEEIGVDSTEINVISTLTPLYIPVSNIVVTPVVGWTDRLPIFTRQEEEVVFIIEADIRTLIDPSIIKVKPFEIRGEMIDIKYFDYKNNVIWGATAMILHELFTILRRGDFSEVE